MPICVTKKKKIVIVGLFAHQIQEVSRACKVHVDLHFVHVDANLSTFPQGDYCLLLTKFISHRHHEKAISSFGRDRVILHRGGIRSCIDRILLANLAPSTIS